MWQILSGERFPAVETASPEGLLLVGGKLSPDWLIDAYRRGIFPWPMSGFWGRVTWFAPDPRAILELDDFHLSRRLTRRLRQAKHTITFDCCFRDVISACALPRPRQPGTWITRGMIEAYSLLHEQGVAHSVEVWQGNSLVGGVYGLAFGGYFAAESMFSRATDASKLALAALIAHLRERRFLLFDVQVLTPHTARLGAKDVPRSEFQRRLAQALAAPTCF